MKLLVLGGTKFLGRGIVDAALARGHEVTLFNRGRTDPDLYPEAEHLRGDRDGDLAALEGRTWDAVVDTSGYVPRIVRASAELLAGSGHYVFISSISVYGLEVAPGFDESAPLLELDDPSSEDVPAHYGELKALCERVVADVFPDRHTNLRAGLIVGPYDPTGRFTYWPVRIAAGGDVLAPGDPERRVQFVDVRDLGAWIVHVAEHRISGRFNATGPESPITMREMLEACGDANLVWIDEQFLLDRDVGPWMELPLWMPAQDNGFLEADISRALEAGLRFRPIEETARDTLEWMHAGGGTSPLASGAELGEVGLRPEREAEMLEEWKARA